MDALRSARQGIMSFLAPKAEQPPKLEPKPCGEVDYDLLADEAIQKYPKILKRLAE